MVALAISSQLPVTGAPVDLQRWAIGEIENVLHENDKLFEQNGFTLRNIFEATKGNLGQAALSILTHDKPVVRILTGFYINDAKAAETDGPSSAAQLAYFFKQVGVDCCLATDKHCSRVCHAALDAVNCGEYLEVIEDDSTETVERTAKKWAQQGVTHVISIERPGPSLGNGVPCNMHNETIHKCAPLDHVFWRKGPWVCIGMGDRGNELGFGALPIQIVEQDIPHGDKIVCRTGSDFLITSRVSNWAGNGFLAALGILGDEQWNKCAIESLKPKLMKKVLNSMWQTGAVDGITYIKKPKRISVDALPLRDHEEKASQLLRILRIREQGIISRRSRCEDDAFRPIGIQSGNNLIHKTAA